MDARDIPQAARQRLDKLAQDFEILKEKAARTKSAIDSARERITGKFESDAQYQDTYSTLKRMVEDLPKIKQKARVAEGVLETCQSWVDELPDDLTLEPAGAVDTDGFTLEMVQEQIAEYEEELKELRAVPAWNGATATAAAAEAYVRSLARPKVSGISAGEKLAVTWPHDMHTMFALLFPSQMVEVIVAEAKRLANTPMPVAERKARIALLEREIIKRQRQALALGADAHALPAQAILGVKVVRREAAVKKIERRVAVIGPEL
jgi:hypothetical protein